MCGMVFTRLLMDRMVSLTVLVQRVSESLSAQQESHHSLKN